MEYLLLVIIYGNRVKEIAQDKKNIVQTVYNGISIEKFGEQKYIKEIEEWKSKLKINKNDKIILYTGRVVPEKGVKELIEAFINIENKQNLKLIIAGAVDYSSNKESLYFSELKKISKDYTNIIFTGYVDYNEMPALYAIADIGVIPSTWEEPFALTVIEHLATGNPVIITNSGGMPELVNNNCSIIVDKGNIEQLSSAIIKILGYNEEKFNIISQNAKEQAKKFNKELYCKNFFEKLY